MKQEREEVYAVPCSRAFVVAPEKAEEFKNQKPNPETRKQIEVNIKEIVALKEEGRTDAVTHNHIG